MKEIISYLYNINIINQISFNNEIIFETSNTSYLYREIDDIKVVNILKNYVDELNRNRFFSYKFVNNIFNSIISTHEEKNFVIIDVLNDYKNEVNFYEMIEFYNYSNMLLTNNIKYNNNWDILWEQKIDYLNNHFDNHKINNKMNRVVFNYYSSIAENALIYLIKVKSKFNFTNRVAFVHRRINQPNIKLEFYNPLNFMIDLYIRDMAEYIKSLYYAKKDYINDLKYYLNTNRLDVYSASMLFIRIVYPSIFFDDYEADKLNVNKYIDFEDYEDFIKKIYELINSYILIDKLY